MIAEIQRGQLSHGWIYRLDVVPTDTGMQGADPAGNIETYPSGGYDASCRRVESGHPADRKAITPVSIGHGESGLDDAGQGGDMGELFIDFFIHGLDQSLVGIDNGRNAHLPVRRDFPSKIPGSAKQ